MKQMKILGVLAMAAALGLTACGGGGGKKSSSSKHTHKWGEYKVVKAATCTEDGSEERECSECHEKQSRKIAAGHKWGDWNVTTEATCQHVGSKTRECSVCHNKETEEIPLADHSWGEWQSLSDPDCTNPGSRKHVCTVCQTEETEEVAALGHTYAKAVDAEGNPTDEDAVVWSKEATCTEAGVGEKECTRCHEKAAVTKEALGHDIQLREDTTEPEAGKAAVRIYECSRCDVTYFGFKANEVSEESKKHLVIGDDGGARFWGRPIGNAIALSSDGTSVNQTNYECVYSTAETGDFFEYVFDLTPEQAADLQNVRCYCDAKPAAYLGGQDFWACDESADEWTPGYYIDGAEGHYDTNEDGTPVMVNDHALPVRAEDGSEAAGEQLETQVKQGKRISNYRYILYVDGEVKDFDPEIKAPVSGRGGSEPRAEYVMPYTFKLHAGTNRISLRMAGGYRSTFYNFTFRPVEEEVPPEPVVDEWVADTTTVMPTPAAGAAVVNRFVKEGKDDVKYEIAVATANLTSADSGAWKTDPSTGEFKLNNGKTASFNFALPKAFEGKMYQVSYIDAYNSNSTKKAFYQTNNHSNIEVKVNGNAIDFSQFANTTFKDLFNDELDGSNSVAKEVELGDVVLDANNVITYKRVETLNMIVKGFVFIGKDHDHAFVAGDKAADSALRVASCTCGASGYELQAADLTEGQKAPVASDKNTRLGKNIFDDVWNITGIKAGIYALYLNAQNSSGNDNAYWNAATAIANGDRASNNGSTPELQAEYRYKVKIDNGDYTPIANDTERYSDFGLSSAAAAWTSKPVAVLAIAEGAASLTIHNMNNGYSIWVYAARLLPVA